LGGNEMLLTVNGVGAERAMAAVDAAAWFQPDAIVSTGFCGALDPQLEIADVVVATCVVAGDRRYPTQRLAGESACPTAIVSVDHVVRTAAEKRSLAASGAGAVEMEAAGVAARAAALNLPFYCVKAVSDLAGEDMANDFNRALTRDGHFDTIVLLRGTLGRPLVRIPELFRLRKRCVRASRALGEFFADCRF
jgi:nucleoside phosphorylase